MREKHGLVGMLYEQGPPGCVYMQGDVVGAETTPDDVAFLGQASLLEGRLLLPIVDRPADMPVVAHVAGRLDPCPDGIRKNAAPASVDAAHESLRDDSLDGPEIGGEVGAGEVVVGDPAVTLDAPPGRPGVTDKEHPALVIIPDGHHGMAADIGLATDRERHEAGVHDYRAFEGLVHTDAEDEGDASRQGASEGVAVTVLEEGGLF